MSGHCICGEGPIACFSWGNDRFKMGPDDTIMDYHPRLNEHIHDTPQRVSKFRVATFENNAVEVT